MARENEKEERERKAKMNEKKKCDENYSPLGKLFYENVSRLK